MELVIDSLYSVGGGVVRFTGSLEGARGVEEKLIDTIQKIRDAGLDGRYSLDEIADILRSLDVLTDERYDKFLTLAMLYTKAKADGKISWGEAISMVLAIVS